jgi:serine/threonine protein kinase
MVNEQRRKVEKSILILVPNIYDKYIVCYEELHEISVTLANLYVKMRLNGKEVLDAICKELTSMQSVRSEHICKTHGWCLFENYEVWLVMEFVDGGDLHNYLAKYGKPLPRDLQLSFFIQATKALHTFHAASTALLHKDIKSLNFLVSTSVFYTSFLFCKFSLVIYL